MGASIQPWGTPHGKVAVFDVNWPVYLLVSKTKQAFDLVIEGAVFTLKGSKYPVVKSEKGMVNP